ncbi:MAG: MOSC N-terminal beta barrel domain-containing protein [Haloferacaceae archaeon]
MTESGSEVEPDSEEYRRGGGTDGPHLARIARYPIKSLDPTFPDAARLDDGPGAVSGDREYAIVDADGEFVNGKRTAAVHRLRASFGPDRRTVTFRVEGTDRTATFDLERERDAAATWLSDYFGYEVRLRRRERGGFPDDTAIPGPTVISTGTLREIAGWFDLGVHDARLRFRANLEVGGVPPFWEDRLVADHGEVVRFRVGGVPLLGVNPCKRCVVPSRDPHTGEELPEFRERFLERRRETLPDWSGGDRFDHYFRVMVNTDVPPEGRGGRLSVGDPVDVGDVLPESEAGE